MKFYLASIPNVVGLILAVVKDISQLALCKYRLVVAPHTSFSPEYITSRRVKIINIALFCLLLPGAIMMIILSNHMLRLSPFIRFLLGSCFSRNTNFVLISII